jgi:hypothetical protein
MTIEECELGIESSAAMALLLRVVSAIFILQFAFFNLRFSASDRSLPR